MNSATPSWHRDATSQPAGHLLPPDAVAALLLLLLFTDTVRGLLCSAPIRYSLHPSDISDVVENCDALKQRMAKYAELKLVPSPPIHMHARTVTVLCTRQKSRR